jgi:excisionase family DNA binding protein
MSIESISPKRPRGRPRGSRNRTVITKGMAPPITMRAPDAARYVGVSVSLMKRWITEGKVRTTSIGRVRLVFTASLHALVEGGQ